MKPLTGILLLAVASAQAPAQPATRDVPYATTLLAWLALMCLPRLRWTSTILLS